ncbi:MAG: hypothetical protein ACRC2R_01215 [Xenococcaceae cyanobacterium]
MNNIDSANNSTEPRQIKVNRTANPKEVKTNWDNYHPSVKAVFAKKKEGGIGCQTHGISFETISSECEQKISVISLLAENKDFCRFSELIDIPTRPQTKRNPNFLRDLRDNDFYNVGFILRHLSETRELSIIVHPAFAFRGNGKVAQLKGKQNDYDLAVAEYERLSEQSEEYKKRADTSGKNHQNSENSAIIETPETIETFTREQMQTILEKDRLEQHAKYDKNLADAVDKAVADAEARLRSEAEVRDAIYFKEFKQAAADRDRMQDQIDSNSRILKVLLREAPAAQMALNQKMYELLDDGNRNEIEHCKEFVAAKVAAELVVNLNKRYYGN